MNEETQDLSLWENGETPGCELTKANMSDGITLEEMVFAQDIIRDKIIGYAIRNNEGNLCRQNIGCVRLLQKCWLDSVSKLLAKEHEPLYKLTLNRNNSLKGTPFVNTNGKLLDQFVKLVKNRIEKPFPTFRLRIMDTFFYMENYDSFYNFLIQCGQGLVELQLLIPKGAGYLPCIFFNVDFPNLWKMTVIIKNTVLESPPNEVLKGDENVFFLLQTFLNRNRSLNELVFPFNNQIIPNGFQCMILPPTVTKLSMYCVFSEQNLQILTRSPLTNLTTLKLKVPGFTLTGGFVNNILQKLSKTLKTLELAGEAYFGPPKAVNLVTFPVMEKLEILTLYSINLELESNMCNFGGIFPKLVTSLHKWIADSTSSATTVTTAIVGLVDDSVSQNEPLGFNLPILLEDMKLLHSKFPNIAHLVLFLTARQVCGIQFLFKEMRQLKTLILRVSEHVITLNSNCWDSILTGIPAPIIAGMREHRDVWKFMEFSKELPSIRMLTALQVLALETTPEHLEDEEGVPVFLPSLISDVAFEFAFLKTSRLKGLKLKDRFKASEQSTEAWEKLRRTITYDRFP